MALFDSSPDALFVVEGSGLIVLANQQAEFLFGYARNNMMGKPIEFLMPESVRKAHVQHRGQFSLQPRVRSMGIMLGRPLMGLNASGSQIEVEVSLSPFVTDAGVFTIASVRRRTTPP